MIVQTSSNQSRPSGEARPKNSTAPLTLIIVLYFGIGFITALNDVLVPHFKDLFHLTNVMALLVQFAFFGAYFVMSLPSGRLIVLVGYQRSISVAVFTMGTGLLLFVPASYLARYWMFLGALFVVGSGLSLLQVAINPYLGAFGKPETAASRLNLADGFNSVASALAPRVGAVLIFAVAGASAFQVARSLRLSYLSLAGISFAMAVTALAVRLPHLLQMQTEETDETKIRTGVWRIRHLRLGAIGIFVYVGAEVAIGSLMINFLGQPEMGGLSHTQAVKYVSLYWGCAMVGRFAGSLLLRRIQAQHALAFTSALAMIALFVVMTQAGTLARGALVSCGLFNSVMWPCIFPLSLKGLGRYTSQGSGLLVMMVVGGTVIPELQGWLADHIGYGNSFGVVWLCYAYVLYFALRGHREVPEALTIQPNGIPVEIF